MSWPQTTAVPAVGARKPVIIFIVVDLPAPLGPRNPSTSPCGTVKETSSTATSGPNDLTRCRISSIPARPPMMARLCVLSRRARIKKRNVGGKRFYAPVSPSAVLSMIRRVRLFSGLVMLAYVTMHLLNHAVGLVSLEAMEGVLWYIFRIWSNRPAQALLYGSFLVHYTLALCALWQRRSLRLHVSELSQIILGFAIPILLARHVVGTRIADNFFHTDTGYYAYLLWLYFVRVPEYGYLQMLVLGVAWGHAMIGLHFWLRVRPWYARLQPAALVIAVLVPVLSLLGMIEAGRQVMALAADPNWMREAFARMTLPSPETRQALDTIIDGLSWFFGCVVAVVLLARI